MYCALVLGFSSISSNAKIKNKSEWKLGLESMTKVYLSTMAKPQHGSKMQEEYDWAKMKEQATRYIQKMKL